MRFYRWAFVIVLLLVACQPPPVVKKNRSYSQDFKTPVAVLVQERNGELYAFASSFLINKEQGSFATAKHFVEDIGQNDFKIFFNGKIYDGMVVVTPPISDLAIVAIEDNFNPADFPDPYAFGGGLKRGDKVKIKGIHLHSDQLQAGKKMARILREYYERSWEKKEFVFDDLEAKVGNLAMEIKNEDIRGSPVGFGFISNTYIEMITDKDHQFSFGGLSGGPITDENDKVIGIVAAGREGGHVLINGFIIVYQPWNVIWATPVEELHNLMALLLVDEK